MVGFGKAESLQFFEITAYFFSSFRYPMHDTDLYIGPCFDPVNLLTGPTIKSIEGEKKCLQPIVVDLFCLQWPGATQYGTFHSFDRTCMRSPTLTTNVFGTTGTVTHLVGPISSLRLKLEALLLHSGIQNDNQVAVSVGHQTKHSVRIRASRVWI